MTKTSRGKSTSASGQSGTVQRRRLVPRHVLSRVREAAIGTPDMTLMQWMAEFGVQDYERKSVLIAFKVQSEARLLCDTVMAQIRVSLDDFATKLADQLRTILNPDFESWDETMLMLEAFVKLWARYVWGRLVSPTFLLTSYLSNVCRW